MHGSLEHFRIEELLSMLGGAQKVGALVVEKAGRELGTVHLEAGDVIAAAAQGTSDPIEVVIELAMAGPAAFRFDPVARYEGARVGKKPVAVVLNEVRTRMAAIDGADVPDPDALLRPANRLGSDEVRITSTDWSSLVTIGSGCTVRELASRQNVSLLTALRQAHRLVHQGLVRTVPPGTKRNDQVESLSSLLDRAGRQMAVAASA